MMANHVINYYVKQLLFYQIKMTRVIKTRLTFNTSLLAWPFAYNVVNNMFKYIFLSIHIKTKMFSLYFDIYQCGQTHIPKGFTIKAIICVARASEFQILLSHRVCYMVSVLYISLFALVAFFFFIIVTACISNTVDHSIWFERTFRNPRDN